MTRRPNSMLSVLVAIALHFFGDYVLQRLGVPGSFLNKRYSIIGMVIHAVLADGIAFAWLGYVMGGWRGALYGVLLGTVAHTTVDLMGNFKKALVLKLLDQLAHLTLMGIFVLVFPQPIPSPDVPAQQRYPQG